MIDSLQKELRLTTEQLKAVTQEKTRNQRKLIEKEEHCKLL